MYECADSDWFYIMSNKCECLVRLASEHIAVCLLIILGREMVVNELF